MSAIDDAPDYEVDGLVATIDRAHPCCTLCNDTARWPNGMTCICMGVAPVDLDSETWTLVLYCAKHPNYQCNCKCTLL